MNTGEQILLSAIIASVIAVPLVLYKHKTYRLQGRSVKYLEIKVMTAVGMPIIAIPILLSEISVIAKVMMHSQKVKNRPFLTLQPIDIIGLSFAVK